MTISGKATPSSSAGSDSRPDAVSGSPSAGSAAPEEDVTAQAWRENGQVIYTYLYYIPKTEVTRMSWPTDEPQTCMASYAKL